jgi:hypothetical protein
MRSLLPSGSFVEFQHTFLIWKRFVWNTFRTPVQPPQSLARDWGLRVARNTFLWVLSTHKNFTKDWRTLGKSLRTIQESCWWLGPHPSYSFLFYEIVYKYEAEPPPNIIIFSPLHRSQTKNITELNTFWIAPWNNTSTRSVSFITTIFGLDSFVLSWTKISS